MQNIILTYKIQAIQRLDKTNSGYDIMSETEVLPKNKKISQKQIDKEVELIKKEYEKVNYSVLRSSEYPSIGDQLDSLFKAGVFPEEMAAQIQAVKDKYPKV